MIDGITIATVTITRVLVSDGHDDVIFTEAVDGSGNRLPLIESLGMLRLAEGSVIREAMGEDDE